MEFVDQNGRFAPAFRVPDAEIRRETEHFLNLSPLLLSLLDAVPTIAFTSSAEDGTTFRARYPARMAT